MNEVAKPEVVEAVKFFKFKWLYNGLVRGHNTNPWARFAGPSWFYWVIEARDLGV
jgi:hypothetical protein